MGLGKKNVKERIVIQKAFSFHTFIITFCDGSTAPNLKCNKILKLPTLPSSIASPTLSRLALRKAKGAREFPFTYIVDLQ